MEQSSSSKIVSLHMESCQHECPHRYDCYHRGKVAYKGLPPSEFRQEMLERGYVLHESICNGVTDDQWHLLHSYDNYNITIPYALFDGRLAQFQTQLQITIYTAEQARELEDYQKLFFIRTDKEWGYFLYKHLWNLPYNKMHFVVNQKWVTKEKASDLAWYRMISNSHGTTIDSCLYSYLINGGCPYADGNYIDITFDGTLRKCPFAKTGVGIPEGDYEEWFKVDHKPEECRYNQLFSGETDGKTNVDPSIQDNSTNNQD